MSAIFKKSVAVQATHQLGGKDQKRLVKELALNFPALTEKEVKKLLPSKAEVLVHKMSNKAFVYQVAGGNPVFFEYDEELFPTVYALWKYPKLAEGLLTYSEVSPKLMQGVDLMLPGVIVPPGGLGEFAAKDIRTVMIPDNPHAFGVGRMLTDSAAAAGGMKGKGLNLLHHYPDALWALGDKSVPNAGFKPDRIYPCGGGAPADEGADTKKREGKRKKDRGGAEGAAEAVAGLGLGDAAGGGAAEPPGVDMDELVEYCFFAALEDPGLDALLPLDCSKFYAHHMLAARPAGTEIDIKKSSFKKLSKLMKEMGKKKVIAIKAVRKEDHVVAVRRNPSPALPSSPGGGGPPARRG